MKQLLFLDIFKQKMQSLSVDNLFDVFVYFIAGFILGLIVKYSLRYFLWFLIFSIVSLWLVQNFGIITINYDYLHEFTTLVQDYRLSDLVNLVIAFVKSHIGESLGLIFGFYISWEIL